VEKGFKVNVLDLVNPEKSTCGFNPLSYIKFNSKGRASQKDIKSLSCSLVPELDKDDPYWTLSARKYLAMLIAYVMEILPSEDHNIRSVIELHKEYCIGNMTTLFDETIVDNPDTMFAGMYKEVETLRKSEKTWACVSNFAATALDTFDVTELDEIWINKESFDFKKLGKEKSVLFINISDMDRTFDIVLNLIYSQGLSSLVEYADSNDDGRLDVPVRFIMDDFTSGAPIENFDNIISVIRSRDISVSLIIQSLSQLNSKYGTNEAKTILNNCDHILYLGSNDIDTLHYMSSRLNVAEHIVERLPMKKAYLFSSGKGSRMIDRMQPYSTLEK
jgi:type IV secretion system protein VirD4